MTQNTTKKPACKEVGQPMQDRSVGLQYILDN